VAWQPQGFRPDEQRLVADQVVTPDDRADRSIRAQIQFLLAE
jgi:hypothetical protein